MEGADLVITPDTWSDAVADTDGPQLIVAGPGTGKTQFLVERAVHLLESGSVDPESLLVLTFSRRAAADLRDRIAAALSGPARAVPASTFHSWAYRLLETGGADHPPTLLTAPEQAALVTEVLRNDEPSRWPLPYRPLLTTPSFAAEVADFLLRCSERLLDPENVERLAESRADWRGLPGVYRRYLAELKSRHRIDYGTLLMSAVTTLAERPESAGRIRYVLVDEYQDTTPAAARILEVLADSGAHLTVAGDPYQSIYSFRGAEVGNIATFLERHRLAGRPPPRRLVLSQSFRVPGPILESALRIVSSGRLPGAAGEVSPAPHEGRVEAYVFDQQTAEAEWISAEVERLHLTQGLALDRMAVVVRTKKRLLPELSRALTRRRIPHDPPLSRLVDHPAVRMIADLVTAAVGNDADPAAQPGVAADVDRSLRRIVLGPLLSSTLGAERSLYRERARSGRPWSEILDEHAEISQLLADHSWATAAPASEGFWRVWSTVPHMRRFVERPDLKGHRHALTSLAQALSVQHERDPKVTLARFFDMLDAEEFEATPLLRHDDSGSRLVLTTLHQVKGLEFDVVFIADASEGVFPDLRRRLTLLRPELLSPDRASDGASHHRFQLQEEMRLAYTATTRARSRVVWTATDAAVDEGELRPSRFMMAAAGSEHLGPPTDVVGDPISIREAETMLRRTVSDPGAAPASRAAAAAALAAPQPGWWDPAGFAGIHGRGGDSPIRDPSRRLSPSQASTYDECPRRYAVERVLEMGADSSPYASFGTVLHDVMEHAEKAAMERGDRHATLEEALAALDEIWVDGAFGAPPVDTAWKSRARTFLERLYTLWPSSGAPVALELAVEKEVGNVVWRGRVDRVERDDDGQLKVIDYKTSKTLPSIPEAASSIQLGFYALAVEADSKVPGLVGAAEFWHPLATQQGLATRSFDIDKVNEVHRRLETITASVVEEDWRPRPGAHCARCQIKSSCPAWPEGRESFLP